MSTQLMSVLVLAGIGILNTLYLSYHALTKTPVACLFFPEEMCRKVQFSPQSKTFGVPNPYLGLVMYVSIFVLVLLAARALAPFWPVTLLVVFGFCFSMYFMYVQARVLRAYCTWCVLSAVDFTLLAASLLFL